MDVGRIGHQVVWASTESDLKHNYLLIGTIFNSSRFIIWRKYILNYDYSGKALEAYPLMVNVFQVSDVYTLSATLHSYSGMFENLKITLDNKISP
jgi:hypothetical protein